MPRMLLILFLLVLVPGTTMAQGPVVTLKDLEREALENNPGIKMIEKKAESAEERKSAASGLPDPMIGYMLQNVGGLGTSTVGMEEMSMEGFVVTQEIPFPGKLSTQRERRPKTGGAVRENARETKLRVLSDLRNAYYDYYLAHRSMPHPRRDQGPHEEPAADRGDALRDRAGDPAGRASGAARGLDAARQDRGAGTEEGSPGSGDQCPRRQEPAGAARQARGCVSRHAHHDAWRR